MQTELVMQRALAIDISTAHILSTSPTRSNHKLNSLWEGYDYLVSNLYSYFVWLCGFYYGPFHDESFLALWSCDFFQSCIALRPTRFGKRDLQCKCFSCICCLFCARWFLSVFLFLLMSCVGCGL